MPNRKNPSTSIEAYKSLEPTEVREMYRKITAALLVIGEGTFEDISKYLKVEPSRVWKRLNEMLKMELIYRPGTKKVLKSGRNGFIWRIVGSDGIPKKVTEKSLPGKSVSDFSKQIIKQTSLFK